LRDRAFRRGLILLPAGERALRFYPRYDTPKATIQEAVEILAASVEDILTHGAAVPLGPLLRVGVMTAPPEAVEVIDLEPRNFAEHRAGVMAVEIERYGSISHYPSDVLRAGRRPLLQYPVETIEATLANPRALGLALRFSGRIIAYAVGSPLEDHDEEGVSDDPHYGERQTFYLLAMAIHPSVENAAEIERQLLELLRTRAVGQGYLRLSALIEEQSQRSGPAWLRSAEVLRVLDNYLRSGVRFVYVQAALNSSAEPAGNE
jgi:hypothetical protein